jgi:DNA-binding MarR family transcriptional regulator/ribosomal protein S18 acetylase RimI-like enzyme
MAREGSDVETLRRFNRFYTQRIGVLTDRYLGQARPLGAARVLFEIGMVGADVRELRTRLELDSGYMSRLLRSLERQGLVQVGPHPTDSRVRVAELTPAGRRELSEIDRRATTLAENLLQPLTAEQRTELTGAIERLQRLLQLAAISVEIVDPSSPDAEHCLSLYAEELSRRFPGGFDDSSLVRPADARAPGGAFVMARERSRPVGCGVLRTMAPKVGEIRHVWVDPGFRRLGVARRLLAELEREAVAREHHVVRLDTHEVLTEAIRMYRTLGYREIARYDDNPYAYHWFEKSLHQVASRGEVST